MEIQLETGEEKSANCRFAQERRARSSLSNRNGSIKNGSGEANGPILASAAQDQSPISSNLLAQYKSQPQRLQLNPELAQSKN